MFIRIRHYNHHFFGSRKYRILGSVLIELGLSLFESMPGAYPCTSTVLQMLILTFVVGLIDEHINRQDKGTNFMDTSADIKAKAPHAEILADEKLTTLEEVVEKIVELYVVDIAPEKSKSDRSTMEVPEGVIAKENSEESGNNAKKEQNDDDDDIKECLQSASPSDSASSRATRWEALADIAAELPPSLAVDPLTGQIYVLK